jgi:hypothetical protein
MAAIAGYNLKVRWNGIIYTAQTVDVDETVDNQRWTNSEGSGQPLPMAGFHVSVGANKVATVTVVNAGFDILENLWAPPRSIRSDTFGSLIIYLNGVGSVSWGFPSFHILRSSQRLDVMALEPVTFSGESNGQYSTPIS